VTTSALCLRKIDYSETSQIVTLLTGARGIVGAIAKGAKRPKSSIGVLDVCCLYDVVLYDKSRSELLSVLAQAQLIDFFPRARETYEGFLAAEALREMLLCVEIGPSDGPEALLLSVRALREIPQGPWRACARMGFALLRLLGVEPVFSQCVLTGREPSGRRVVSFALGEMGLVAPPHERGRNDVIRIRPPALAALRAMQLALPEASIRPEGWRGAYALCAFLLARQGGRRLTLAPTLGSPPAV
jgi:DNA repair protein RecO (recombination protein O)